MEQLTLSEETLLKIGFLKTKIAFADFEGNWGEQTAYEISCINSKFYYNPDEKVYKWYYQTTIGESKNSVHLDITQLPALYSIFQAFKVKFNLVII